MERARKRARHPLLCFFFISPLTLSLSVVMQLALRPRVTLASSHSTGASPARRVVALPSRCVE